MTFNIHPPEETLEEYCFNRLPHENAAAIEEHLLICEPCQHTVKNLDEYIALMKAATAEYNLAASSAPTGSTWSRLRNVWSRPFSPSWAIALGAVGAIAVLSWAMISMVTARRAEQPPLAAFVALTAVRGGETLAMNQGPAGRPLDLAIDLADLSVSDAYRMEVVSAQGQPIWDAQETASNGKLSARLPKGLSPGVYWVRLYAARDELLREFGLRVQ